MRDDFSPRTRTTIAQRAGWRCSNPDCRRGTSAPDPVDSEKWLNLGVAAHIEAASREGPRYNTAMSTQERKAAKNGLWLCQTCAKRIDSSTETYLIDILTLWKKNAERIAAKDARTTGNEITELSSDIETTISAIIAFTKKWYEGILEIQSEQMRLQREARRKNDEKLADEIFARESGAVFKYSSEQASAYLEYIKPQIEDCIERAERILGVDNELIQQVRSANRYAGYVPTVVEEITASLRRLRNALELH